MYRKFFIAGFALAATLCFAAPLDTALNKLDTGGPPGTAPIATVQPAQFDTISDMAYLIAEPALQAVNAMADSGMIVPPIQADERRLLAIASSQLDVRPDNGPPRPSIAYSASRPHYDDLGFYMREDRQFVRL